MKTLLKPASETQILVVDDLPDNVRLLALILEVRGYTVLKALSGRTALQVVQHSPPDLILLDINMPGLSGYEVCEQIRAAQGTAYIPVIFISALDHLEAIVQAFEVGGQDYITKPFHEEEVLVRVRNQLLIHQHIQMLQQKIQHYQQAEVEMRRRYADSQHNTSYKLREPLTSIKMVLKLLNALTDRGRNLLAEMSSSAEQNNRMAQYFKILDQECDRELALIEDLLGHHPDNHWP